jgi:hypothetical protein
VRWTYFLSGRGEDTDVAVRMGGEDVLQPEILGAVLGEEPLEIIDITPR